MLTTSSSHGYCQIGGGRGYREFHTQESLFALIEAAYDDCAL